MKNFFFSLLVLFVTTAFAQNVNPDPLLQRFIDTEACVVKKHDGVGYIYKFECTETSSRLFQMLTAYPSFDRLDVPYELPNNLVYFGFTDLNGNTGVLQLLKTQNGVVAMLAYNE